MPAPTAWLLQDFHGGRGRSEEGCLCRLRRRGHEQQTKGRLVSSDSGLYSLAFFCSPAPLLSSLPPSLSRPLSLPPSLSVPPSPRHARLLSPFHGYTRLLWSEPL